MKEKTIEKYAVELAKQRGGAAEKWGIDGWHDRIVIIPNAIGLLELKRPGKGMRTRQRVRNEWANRMGVVSACADTFEDVDEFFRRLDVRAWVTPAEGVQ